MNEAKIILVPCRQDMPLTGVLRSSLAVQFPGMIEIVPPPDTPVSRSALLRPPEESLRVLQEVVVLVDSLSLKTRPGFVRALLSSPGAEEAIVVASDFSCQHLLREFLSRNVCERVICATNPRGIVALLLRGLERTPHSGIRRSLRAECGLDGIVGESRSIIEIKQRLPAIAGSNEPVLITGETGTGKEVVAHAIHYLSPRRDKPFVPIHCGALPSDLFENELFGHRSGAYTGAQGEQKGLIAQANHGTLFLDEISTLPTSGQAKLLRVLQEGEYRPLGGGTMIRADIRILAASNADLDEAVKQGSFRSDLFYRLNSIVVKILPLHERREDILPLAHHFLRLFAQKYRKDITHFSPIALAQLERHEWLGNVRELEHTIGQAVLFSSGGEITEIIHQQSVREEGHPFSTYHAAKRQALEEFERVFLTRTIQKAEGNLSLAARLAGLERSSFVRLLRKYQIPREGINETE